VHPTVHAVSVLREISDLCVRGANASKSQGDALSLTSEFALDAIGGEQGSSAIRSLTVDGRELGVTGPEISPMLG
jgi:hypothetical protein